MSDCLERYKTEANFLFVFNPANQYQYSMFPERCIRGAAPTLDTVCKAYGPKVAESWVSIQLRDLSEYAGCRDKLTIMQIDQIAKVVCSQFHYLKVTELMYFFVLFKSGEFGRFYGAVDGLTITEALNGYKRKKMAIEAKIERDRQEQERRKERERHSKEVVTREEWLELKWLYNLGYEPRHIEQAKKEREHDLQRIHIKM